MSLDSGLKRGLASLIAKLAASNNRAARHIWTEIQHDFFFKHQKEVISSWSTWYLLISIYWFLLTLILKNATYVVFSFLFPAIFSDETWSQTEKKSHNKKHWQETPDDFNYKLPRTQKTGSSLKFMKLGLTGGMPQGYGHHSSGCITSGTCIYSVTREQRKPSYPQSCWTLRVVKNMHRVPNAFSYFNPFVKLNLNAHTYKNRPHGCTFASPVGCLCCLSGLGFSSQSKQRKESF